MPVIGVDVVRTHVDAHRRRRHQDALRVAPPLSDVIGPSEDHRGLSLGPWDDGGVLRLAVTAQINLALERSGADAAGERLEAGVLATVSDEVRRLTKGLATLATNVRLLSCNTRDIHPYSP